MHYVVIEQGANVWYTYRYSSYSEQRTITPISIKSGTVDWILDDGRALILGKTVKLRKLPMKRVISVCVK